MRRSLNNLRPIALTSHALKCYERIILGHLSRQESVFQNPLQFAHKKDVGVDDDTFYIA